jgi:hypothetical protein
VKHQVVVQRLAREDLGGAYAWVFRHAPDTAERWLLRFEESLLNLESYPERCPLARENQKVNRELREFHFGKRPYVFRVVFTIDGDVVRILRILRAQRRALTRKETEQANDDR